MQEAPAQLGVHREAIQRGRPVEQPGEEREIRLPGGHAGEGVQVGKLPIGAWLGAVHEVTRCARHLCQALVAPGRVGVPAHGGTGLPQQGLQH